MRKELSKKNVLAWVFNLIGLSVIVYLGLLIPATFWAKLGTVLFTIGCLVAVIVPLAIWIVAMIAGAIAIIGLFVPTVVYVCQWFYWAFMYSIMPKRKEPTFPPVWSLKEIWIPIGIWIADNCVCTIVVTVIITAAACILAGIALIIDALVIIGVLLIVVLVIAGAAWTISDY